ncbi:carbohydrate binding domain-containing protein [Streptomyces sp. NPDC048696]|uniref:carbohydrate binding domain-containing protein n=1 Tax=Streptomyces sp. NPDC048696 TaxID=3365585 RepID=UPI00371CD694
MRIVVQAGFGFAPTASSVTWTDITPWVDLKAGIRITRGAADELSQIQPGTCSLTLDNDGGRFSAGTAASPYYPYVRPNCPLRVMELTAAKNLVREGTFEETSPGSGLYANTGWEDNSTQPPLSSLVDLTRAHQGSASLLTQWNDSSIGYSGIEQTIVYGLEIDRTYVASGWVWVSTGSPAVRWQIDGGAVLGGPSTVTGAWQRITVVWTATAPSHILQLTTIAVTTPGGSVWLDEVQVEEGTSPTAFDSTFARLHARFYGAVGEWPAKWTGLHSTVRITATDLLKSLASLPQLEPLLAEEILQLQPSVYYPLTEPDGSATAGDLSGSGATSLSSVQIGSGGTLVVGQATGPAATGRTAAWFTPVSASAGQYLSADLGPQVEALSRRYFNWIEGWFCTSIPDRVICGFASSSSQYQLVFALNASGQFIIEYTDNGTSRLTETPSGAAWADGRWHHFFYDEWNHNLYLDGGSALPVFTASMMSLRQLIVGGWAGTRLWSGQIAHIAMHTRPTGDLAPGWITAHFAAGALGFSGELADQRMKRLAGYAGITSVISSGSFRPVGSQGGGGSNALEMMRTVEATEGGKFMADRGSGSLVFQARSIRYNAPPSVVISFADLETGDVEMPVDDQKLVNDVTGVRPGGATQRVKSDASIAAYGRYPKDLTVLKTTDNEVVDAMSWLVYRYADPQPELRNIPVEAYTMPLATYRSLLDADVSTLLTITSMPAQAAAPTVTATVEGYVETIGMENHRIDFYTSRTATDSVWVLDDPTYAVLGTTTRLAY